MAMKTTYNGTYTQVEELESSDGIFFLKQSLKDTALQDSFVRANFLSGARFLQTLKDPHILTIDEVIQLFYEYDVLLDKWNTYITDKAKIRIYILCLYAMSKIDTAI